VDESDISKKATAAEVTASPAPVTRQPCGDVGRLIVLANLMLVGGPGSVRYKQFLAFVELERVVGEFVDLPAQGDRGRSRSGSGRTRSVLLAVEGFRNSTSVGPHGYCGDGQDEHGDEDPPRQPAQRDRHAQRGRQSQADRRGELHTENSQWSLALYPGSMAGRGLPRVGSAWYRRLVGEAFMYSDTLTPTEGGRSRLAGSGCAVWLIKRAAPVLSGGRSARVQDAGSGVAQDCHAVDTQMVGWSVPDFIDTDLGCQIG
jgi:hypothetical protein